jgi:hypothetical protein
VELVVEEMVELVVTPVDQQQQLEEQIQAAVVEVLEMLLDLQEQ